MHTHDTTCGSDIGVSGSTKWADFTKFVLEGTAGNAKVRPSRQVPLFPPTGGAVARAGGGAARAAHVPPAGGDSSALVHSCISQQAGGPGAARPGYSARASLLGVRFEVYKKSVRVVRPVPPMVGTRGGKRSAVDAFSEASKRRLRRLASESGDVLVSQFLLTYQHTDPDGESCKRHLNTWLTWLRRRVPGVKYLWILEFQKRGVPHFHVFLNISKDNPELHKEMALKWHLISIEEDKAHLAFHENARNWIDWDMGSGSYVCKYLDKANQKHVPSYFGWVGRFWGASRGLMEKPCVYDAHEMRAMCGQNTDEARVIASRETHCVPGNVSRETSERDSTALILRALGNYQASKWRKYGRKSKHLTRTRSSRWVQDGAAVLWRVVEATLGGDYG